MHDTGQTIGECDSHMAFASTRRIEKKARLYPTGRHWVDNVITPSPGRDIFLCNEFSPGHYLVRWVRVKG